MAERDEAIAELEAATAGTRHPGRIIGVTGTPGAGKSSLLSRLADAVVALDLQVTVAIVAVDPSSPTSRGALLGDRTRMTLTDAHERVFFRSQASATALGGLAPSTFHVCHALSLIFDIVLVETVGVGQSEADIRHLADRVYLVVAPLGGDEIQYLKAGIVEVPDVFVINKWDEPAARTTYHQLRASLWLARPQDGHDLPILRTSARTGHGIDELAQSILTTASGPGTPVAAKAPHFFRAWVVDEWGRTGVRHLADLGGAAAVLAGSGGFSAAQATFERSLRESLRQ